MSFGQWASDFLGVPLEERFNFNPLTYFLYSGIDGAWLDPEDTSTMYQDAAGTIPVTALEQPVGKWLDKSGNGNHATQSITKSRPTLSARYNQLTNTDSFVGWVHDNVSTTSKYGTDPNGQQTASLLTNKAGSNTFLRVPDGIVASVKTFSCRVKQSSTGWVRLVIAHPWGANAAGCYFNTTTCELGSIALYGTGYTVIGTPKVRAIVDDWVYTSITVSGPPERMQLVFSIAAADGNNVSPVGATCQICWPDLRLGVSADVYQRVNTATDYDTDPTKFPKYLNFDGIDDYLNLPYMGLYANVAASIVAARDALSQTADTYVISERSTSNVNPKYFPSRQLANAGNMDSYIVNDAAAVVVNTVGSAYGGASDAVVRSAIDSGNNIKLFKNGALAANDNYTRSGTLTLNTTTIGASVSTTTSNYASMKLYGLIVTKLALSDTDRRRCEQFLASRLSTLGVTLS